jgi:archaellum component FlaC
MQRDIQFNAQSLLIGVLEKNTDIVGNITKDEQRSRVLNGSKNENFEQVVEDIDKIDSSITSFFNTPEVNGITINYDDLCSDYEKELSKIEHLFKDNKIQLERKNVLFDLYIKASKKVKLKEEDWSLLKEITKKKVNEHIN